MADQKGKLKTIGLIAIGFLMGSVLAGGLMAWNYSRIFKQQYYNGILSNANTAYMIRADAQEELLKNIEGNIQQCLVSADLRWRNDKNRLDAFWYVQRYYEKYKLPIPANIKSILDALPPHPRQECRLHQKEAVEEPPKR